MQKSQQTAFMLFVGIKFSKADIGFMPVFEYAYKTLILSDYHI